MPNDSYSQQSLAIDPNFRLRVQDALSVVSWQVLGEDPSTPGHEAREAYARNAINNLGGAAQAVAAWLVDRPNLIGETTSYDFKARATVSTASDAALQSQIATDWNMLANVDVP
jgi:hypothetical protein